MSSQKITDTFKQVKSRRVQSNKQLKQADVNRNGDVKNKALDIKESEGELALVNHNFYFFLNIVFETVQ